MAIQRIAIICIHTSPLDTLGGKKTGGMNVYVREVAREMGRRGIHVDVYTRRSAPDQPEVSHDLGEHVRVIAVPCGPPTVLDPQAVYPYLQQFAAGVIAFTTRHGVPPYDVVYSHYWLSGWVADKLREVWGTPFAQMFHTLGQMKNRILPDFNGIRLPDERVSMEMRLMDWADRLIAATPAEHAQLLWLYRADRRKIVIVPPGVDAGRFRPMPAEQARLQVGLDPQQNVLLFVGRIEPLKAVDCILEALAIIQRERPDLLDNTRFLVIGGRPGDPELTQLERLAHTLGIADHVDFIGSKDQSLLPAYYAAATAVMMPSDYESFGMVALEAMASGTPVIASKVGGLAYLVEDDRTGYLVPAREPSALADRIALLLAQPETRQRLGAQAAQVAAQYTWARIVDRLLVVFEDMQAGKRRVRSSVL